MRLDTTEILRYQRQIALPEVGIEGQLTLKQSKVLCVGAGGLASVLLPYLTAAGVGTIGIVDDDVIDVTNLQRQIMYHTQQVGMKKVAAANIFLQQLNSVATIHTYDTKLNRDNAAKIMADYDIVADCTDQLAVRYIINAVCHELSKPFVFAGISQYQGQCMLFQSQHGPCFQCLFPDPEDSNILPDCNAGVLAVLPGLVGMMQASLLLRHLLQIDADAVNKLHTVDIKKFQFESYSVTKNEDCSVCVKQQYNLLGTQSALCQSIIAISYEELTQALAADPGITLLDVRYQEEHERKNIGGLLIPLPELPMRLHELNPENTIIIYCKSGIRSAVAARVLLQNGFKSVQHLAGGITFSCN